MGVASGYITQGSYYDLTQQLLAKPSGAGAKPAEVIKKDRCFLFRPCCAQKIILKNFGGAEARNHLAVERTYIGLRTALSLIGIGLTLAKLTHRTPGYTIVLLGIIFMFWATNRYTVLTKALLRGRFELDPCHAISLSVFTLVFIVFAIVVN